MKKAFTLAEVLITLGIIGVVAAMTIPSLINAYRERVTVTKVQKAYSLLSLAFKQITEAYGVPPYAYPGVENFNHSCSTCAAIKRDLYKSQLGGEASNLSGLNYTVYNLDGSKNLIPVNNWPTLTLNNGMTIIFSNDRICGGYMLTPGKQTACGMGSDVVVDINGSNSGPNTVGKDVFGFTTALDGIYPDGLSSSSHDNTCALDKSGLGCTYKILTEKNMKYLKQK